MASQTQVREARDKIVAQKFDQYGLDKVLDVHKHKNYTIITRTGIEKIQASANVQVSYEGMTVDWGQRTAFVKAVATKDNVKVETYGSVKMQANGDYKSGNCQTWYLPEMAEKRALSRAVLKITGFYEHGVFGEDESLDFKQHSSEPTEYEKHKNAIDSCLSQAELTKYMQQNGGKVTRLELREYALRLYDELPKV